MEYMALMERLEALNDQVSEVMRGQHLRDLRRLAELRCERAWVEMRLRDLWGPWSNRGHRWNAWMWDDITQAKAIASELAAQVGDRQLPERLFMPYPALAAVVSC